MVLHNLVSPQCIKDCFKINTTLQKCNDKPDLLIQWFATLNMVCKRLGASVIQRNSIPEGYFSEDQIEEILLELIKSSEKWNSMKLIILGHGQIGKTTLLTEFKTLIDPRFKVHGEGAIIVFFNMIYLGSRHCEYCGS